MSSAPEPQDPAAEPRVARRELFASAASGFMGLVTACGQAGSRTEVVQTADGKVLQWERDDLLVLVSGVRDSYRVGDEIRLKVLLNNQTGRFGLYKVRTKLAGRAQQVVAELPVETVQVRPFDASEIERTLRLTPQVVAGDYTLIVELPPWSLEGRVTGGGSLTTRLTLN